MMRSLTPLLPLLFALPTCVAAQTADGPFDHLHPREIGPVNMSGRIVDLAVAELDPYTFYVASATGGVWKTTNNGVTFSAVFSHEGTHSVGAIALHQRDTNVVWVGTGERANRQSSSWGDGVYRSVDGGDTWRNMGLHDSHHIGRIALHPEDVNTVFVAAMGHLWGPNAERGLYKTTDGGETWRRVLSVDEHTGVVDVAIDPSRPNVMYAATYQRRRRPYGFNGGGPGSGLHKSVDGGDTWRELTAGLPEGDLGRIGITIYRSDPRIVYVSVEQGWRYNASTAYGERRAGVYRSDDRGETWEHRSDWNPRPMYASQPLVDPNDDQRIYMMNSYSVSVDGGRTFRRVPQSLHSDDRILWVNPGDSRHVLKGDDGGLGISHDMGVTWLYVNSLPVSQFYRVSVDMRDPYWVYGGLQDNGSWAGPNATFRSEGILVDDWFKTGGGDGFLSLVDTTDNRTLYGESQYLGLFRMDLDTRLTKSIRPDNARGAIQARRNWDAWGPGVPEPELGNAMAPANWDGPFIISPHDHRTLYAGTNRLWKSVDRGDTWMSLGELTTGVNRRDLLIMAERAHDSTLSLDDGIPYFPTLTAVAESPLRPGVLYVGTDDGNVQVSLDDGRTWTNVADRMPGLPEMAWISGIEPSRHDEGTVYVTVNNYRNNDFANYLYRSADHGETWTSIVGDLPADRVLRTTREDPRNPQVLFVGAELGLFYSRNGGANWSRLRFDLPTMAFNDLVIHPRDNDLVLGTHSRGVWILDQINALQEMTDDILASPAHLFTVEPAAMIRYQEEKAHLGDMVFQGENPPAGAIVDYYLRDRVDAAAIDLTVLDETGTLVAHLTPDTLPGVNRALWNLRHDGPAAGGFGPQANRGGPWVLPGQYTVRLSVDGTRFEQPVVVRDDPRIDIDDATREAWHGTVMDIAGMLSAHQARTDALRDVERAVSEMDDAAGRHAAIIDDLREVLPLADELENRLRRLYGSVMGWPGPITADERSRIAYFQGWIERLAPRIDAILDAGPTP